MRREETSKLHMRSTHLYATWVLQDSFRGSKVTFIKAKVVSLLSSASCKNNILMCIFPIHFSFLLRTGWYLRSSFPNEFSLFGPVVEETVSCIHLWIWNNPTIIFPLLREAASLEVERSQRWRRRSNWIVESWKCSKTSQVIGTIHNQWSFSLQVTEFQWDGFITT